MRKVDFTSNQANNQSEIVTAIKANDDRVLQSLYTENYHKVEVLVLKNNGTKEQAKDIYQEVFLAVWKNIKLDKFTPQSKNSLAGYLYTIAKNKWMDYLRSKEYKKTINSSQINDFQIFEFTAETDINNHKEEQLKEIMNAFKSLEKPCKSLLRKFYFDKKTMKEIASELQLDAASTRNKKYRCMQKLRELAVKKNI